MRIFAHLLLVAASTVCATGAEAQKYYMRERLMGVATTTQSTYTPGYGSYGACSGGSQSATITSCKDSANNDVALTLCSPQSKSQDCTAPVVCESLQPNRAATGRSIGSELQTKIITRAAMDVACARLAAKYPTIAICQAYNTAANYTKTVVYAYGPGTTFENDDSGLAFGGYCR